NANPTIAIVATAMIVLRSILFMISSSMPRRAQETELCSSAKRRVQSMDRVPIVPEAIVFEDNGLGRSRDTGPWSGFFYWKKNGANDHLKRFPSASHPALK